MDHILVAKRGEVMLMKKMGILVPMALPSSACQRNYKAFFNRKLSTLDVEAFDELFPATKTRASQATRRTLITMV